MVKVELVFGTTHNALTTVSFPNLTFHMGGNDSSSFCVWTDGYAEVFLAFDRQQLKFEDLAAFALLLP